MLRRAIAVAGLSVAALVLTAVPASADGCGTVYVPGQDSFEVCNPLVQTVEDLLERS
jgi:hypothetical protein